jgi:hypothetical protein
MNDIRCEWCGISRASLRESKGECLRNIEITYSRVPLVQYEFIACRACLIQKGAEDE